jgi:hypothetical protein
LSSLIRTKIVTSSLWTESRWLDDSNPRGKERRSDTVAGTTTHGHWKTYYCGSFPWTKHHPKTASRVLSLKYARLQSAEASTLPVLYRHKHVLSSGSMLRTRAQQKQRSQQLVTLLSLTVIHPLGSRMVSNNDREWHEQKGGSHTKR